MSSIRSISLIICLSFQGTKNKLMKERQWKENMQQKWHQEKEKMNRDIKSLQEKIKRFNEER